ncbi:MAG TPA: Lrp/AsnC family transcriptional regulator [Dehalococcoidia bacterium]|nr:Lrp/AsnC family transcriptional regulator [Dehalococcoidia bacterium]
MTIKAYVLVGCDPNKTKRVVSALDGVTGVVEIHEVMGPYDIVAEIEVESLTEIPAILGDHIRQIDGVQSTTSLVSLP